MTHTATLAAALPPWSGPYPPYAVVPHALTAAFLLAASALLFLAFYTRAYHR